MLVHPSRATHLAQPEPSALSPLMQVVARASCAAAAQGSIAPHAMLTYGSQVERLLVEPINIFWHMRQHIASARSEVLFQTFSWHDASWGAQELRAGLQALAHRRPRPPVTVHLMLRRGPALGVAAQDHHALHRLIATLDPAYVRVQLWEHRERAFGALHSKSLVVDGKRAVVTGANPELSHTLPAGCTDTGIVLRGPVAHSLRCDLLELRSRCRLAVTNDPTMGPPLALALPRPREGGVPMLVAGRRANGCPWQRRLDNPQDQAFLSAIAHACRRICIYSPNLNVGPLRRALVDAVARGVEVRLLLSKGFNEVTQGLGQGGGNAHNVRRLYRALRRRDAAEGGLDVRWYTTAQGLAPLEGNGPRSSHAKGASFDDQLLVLGSGNMDTQSWFRSRELNVVIDSAEVTAQWSREVFEPRFQRAVSSCLP
jgi:phosphatidylserine/phosphatidylglycerophosphate/cardiolipin synthase-like enzyme